MDLHQLGKEHDHLEQTREKQQPKNVEGLTKAYRNAKRPTKNQRKSIRRKQIALDEDHFHKKPQKTSFETAKP